MARYHRGDFSDGANLIAPVDPGRGTKAVKGARGAAFAQRLALLSACTAMIGGLAAAPAGAATLGSPLTSQEWWLNGTLDYSGAWTSTEGDNATVALIGPAIDPAQPDLAESLLPSTAYPANAPNMDTNPNTIACYSTQAATLIAGHGHSDAAVTGGVNGMFGVAPHAQILPITVGHVGTKNFLDPVFLAEAIRSVTARHIKVIDLSFAAESSSPELTRAVNDALAGGAIIIAPQGDGQYKTGTPAVPANIRGVIGVSAVDQNLQPAPFVAGDGQAVVAAPGVGVAAGNTGGKYVLTHQGTNCAAAIVAGEAALLTALHPNWTSGQVVRVIVQTASGHGQRTDPHLGYGIVNPTAAVAAPAPAQTTNPLLPASATAPSPASSSGGSIILIVLIVVGALLLVGLVWLLVRFVRGRRRSYVIPEPAPYLSAGPMELTAQQQYQQYSGWTDEWANSGEWAQPAPGPQQQPAETTGSHPAVAQPFAQQGFETDQGYDTGQHYAIPQQYTPEDLYASGQHYTLPPPQAAQPDPTAQPHPEAQPQPEFQPQPGPGAPGQPAQYPTAHEAPGTAAHEGVDPQAGSGSWSPWAEAPAPAPPPGGEESGS